MKLGYQMNRIIKLKLLVVTALLLMFTGCNDLLENVEPATSVSGEQVLSTPEGVESLRSSMYNKVHSSFAYRTEYFVAPSAFTDETRNRPGSTRYQELNEARGSTCCSNIGSWGAHYQIIQDANLLIGAVEDGVLDQENLDQIQGEAHALRAFAMHNLVKAYGYEPGNFDMGPESNWDLGVIIRTEPVLDVADADERPRSTVEQVYLAILNDLQSAKTLLAGVNSDNTFVTEAFVDGISARVNLYAGNWSDAADAAQRAIDNFPGALETTADGVAEMFDENIGDHPEALFKVVVNPDTEGGGFGNDGPATYTSDGFLAQLPTQFLIDKYDADDHRMGWYRDCADAQRIALNQPTGCDAINDEGYSLVKFNGAKGNNVDDLPYMRLAEMYLIRAEALAKDANSAASGLAPLQDLRDARNAGDVPVTALASIEDFEDFILDERMRELALEGHRFYDLKRLGRDIRNPDGSIKMRADSYRILAPIGNTILSENPELVENPEY